jgi:ATP-dependent DNA helicase RecG
MLDKPVQYLKGIGPKKAVTLEKLGITTIEDLLKYFPRSYEDRRTTTRIKDIFFDSRVLIEAKVESVAEKRTNPFMAIFKVLLDDGTGKCWAVFFRKTNPYFKHDIFSKYKKDFQLGATVLAYGSTEYSFGELQLKVEEYETVNSGAAASLAFKRIVPVYPLTEGLSQKWLRDEVHRAIELHKKDLPDILPEYVKKQESLYLPETAVEKIHFPEEPSEAENARQRFALEEFLTLETALELSRADSSSKIKPRKYTIKKTLLTPFRQKLGFEFTAAQKHVINEIFTDMLSSKQMNRLLMGDVGSGKTVVALSAMLLACENGYQSALVAPTEILAEQHFMTLKQTLAEIDVKIALLTSKSGKKKSEKAKLLKEIKNGDFDIVIGTHALLEENVEFKNLALAVIDEQHRFGVLQRKELLKKSEAPDVLVMTATPIPRTLALTLYGDLDTSVIDTLPKGRQPIETLHSSDSMAYEMVKQEIKNGRQAYIVYPLIEESDKIELKAAVKEAESLSKSVFKEYRVGLLHGQMPSNEKEKAMLDFRNKAFDILITTTVIEVGIDIPNATIIVIEHSDRFGLATLHQLRGRVGRGKDKSFCVLLGEPKSDDAKRRLQTMVARSNGFKIAEEDLQIRGPGEFMGTAQHGMPLFKAGNIVTDLKLIEKAKQYAKEIVAADPKLENPENKLFRQELLKLYKARIGLARIG